MASKSEDNGSNYVEEYLPPSIVERLQAAAFRSLVEHLKERSDQVQNIDLMTLSGFCRNCLAKWMVLEARQLVNDGGVSSQDDREALNALGYDEAAQYIYGCDYKEWKKRHAKKATEDQMQRYNDSKPLHAKHDKDLLATKGDKPSLARFTNAAVQSSSTNEEQPSSSGLLSNVCCQDVEEQEATPPKQPSKPDSNVVTPSKNKKARSVGAYVPPPPPQELSSFKYAVLTVSDRASKGEYDTGDLSGPAVEASIQSVLSSFEQMLEGKSIGPAVIVPDNVEAIQEALQEFHTKGVDCILTTGGTGFAKRDVTPEATRTLDSFIESPGLMQFVTNECSTQQPLASLSRGTAGVLEGTTLICNLPGNPKGVEEIIPVLLPLALHAVSDLKRV